MNGAFLTNELTKMPIDPATGEENSSILMELLAGQKDIPYMISILENGQELIRRMVLPCGTNITTMKMEMMYLILVKEFLQWLNSKMKIRM